MKLNYTKLPNEVVKNEYGELAVFNDNEEQRNIDINVVQDFGVEWEKFNEFDLQELEKIGNDYFDILDSKGILSQQSIVLDAGCGSGRWSKVLCRKVGRIEAIDPSNAAFVAQKMLNREQNVRVTKASIDNIPFANNTFDLIMSIGVLHHIPNTQLALKKLVEKIKPGGYFYGYLYYKLENRGVLFNTLFCISNLIRIVISRLPSKLKGIICDMLAVLIYLPFAFFSILVKNMFKNKSYYRNMPLSYYHDKSLMIMRNDALDRFGTKLEKRYSKSEIEVLTNACGLTDLKFSNREPYWHFIAIKNE